MSHIKASEEALSKKGISDTETLAHYDFTDDTACEAYKKLDGLERFFVYMIQSIKNIDWDKTGKVVYENGKRKYDENEASGIFQGLDDPDSKSPLLQNIYRCLWEERYLEHCERSDKQKGKIICGDTMNSVNTTLNALVAADKTEAQQFKMMNPRSSQNMSKAYIINRYYDPLDRKIAEMLNANNDLTDFVNIYHTLGNYIPFPVNCNATRAKAAHIKDYWDLTLKCIYDYYHPAVTSGYCEFKPEARDTTAIDEICGESGESTFYRIKDWLDEYGTGSGSEAWKNFVEKNYMSAFLDEKTGRPKELWSGHFDGLDVPFADDSYDPLPGKPEDYNEYFRNAAKCIEERGKEMAKALFKKLAEEIQL